MPIKSGTAFRELVGQYKRNAQKRQLDWGISDDQFRVLTSSPCYYTKSLPSSYSRTDCETYTYNGIDRKDNSRGYTPENCVPCCGKVNRMKMDTQYDRFIELCQIVASRDREIRAACGR